MHAQEFSIQDRNLFYSFEEGDVIFKCKIDNKYKGPELSRLYFI